METTLEHGFYAPGSLGEEVSSSNYLDFGQTPRFKRPKMEFRISPSSLLVKRNSASDLHALENSAGVEVSAPVLMSSNIDHHHHHGFEKGFDLGAGKAINNKIGKGNNKRKMDGENNSHGKTQNDTDASCKSSSRTGRFTAEERKILVSLIWEDDPVLSAFCHQQRKQHVHGKSFMHLITDRFNKRTKRQRSHEAVRHHLKLRRSNLGPLLERVPNATPTERDFRMLEKLLEHRWVCTNQNACTRCLQMHRLRVQRGLAKCGYDNCVICDHTLPDVKEPFDARELLLDIRRRFYSKMSIDTSSPVPSSCASTASLSPHPTPGSRRYSSDEHSTYGFSNANSVISSSSSVASSSPYNGDHHHHHHQQQQHNTHHSIHHHSGNNNNNQHHQQQTQNNNNQNFSFGSNNNNDNGNDGAFGNHPNLFDGATKQLLSQPSGGSSNSATLANILKFHNEFDLYQNNPSTPHYNNNYHGDNDYFGQTSSSSSSSGKRSPQYRLLQQQLGHFQNYDDDLSPVGYIGNENNSAGVNGQQQVTSPGGGKSSTLLLQNLGPLSFWNNMENNSPPATPTSTAAFMGLEFMPSPQRKRTKMVKDDSEPSSSAQVEK